jgi:hypothetical protein
MLFKRNEIHRLRYLLSKLNVVKDLLHSRSWGLSPGRKKESFLFFFQRPNQLVAGGLVTRCEATGTSILRHFRKIAKSDYGVRRVHLSVRMAKLGPH